MTSKICHVEQNYSKWNFLLHGQCPRRPRQISCMIGYIWMLNLQIFTNCWQHIQYKCIFPPAGRLKGKQKLFNCWQNISIYNINLYIQLTNVPAYIYMFFIICIFFMFYMWTPGNIIFDVLGYQKAHISTFL